MEGRKQIEVITKTDAEVFTAAVILAAVHARSYSRMKSHVTVLADLAQPGRLSLGSAREFFN